MRESTNYRYKIPESTDPIMKSIYDILTINTPAIDNQLKVIEDKTAEIENTTTEIEDRTIELISDVVDDFSTDRIYWCGVTSGTNNFTIQNSKINSYNIPLTIRVQIGTTSTGPCTIKINELETIPLVDGYGNPIANGVLKEGLIYQFAYNGRNFQLLGKGGGGTATPDKLLEGYTASNNNGMFTGTMRNNGSINTSLALNSTYTIPQGYHDGTGIVSQNITTQGGQTLPVNLSFTDSYNLDVSIPKGAYFTERSGKQYPEIKILTNDILNTIGLTGNFIAKPIGGIPAFAKRFKAGESQIHYRQYNSGGYGYQEYFINIDVDFTPMCFLIYELLPSNFSLSNFEVYCLNYDNKNFNRYTESEYRKDKGTQYSKYSSTWNSSKRIIVYGHDTYRDYDTEFTDELYRPNNQVASVKWVAFGN